MSNHEQLADIAHTLRCRADEVDRFMNSVHRPPFSELIKVKKSLFSTQDGTMVREAADELTQAATALRDNDVKLRVQLAEIQVLKDKAELERRSLDASEAMVASLKVEVKDLRVERKSQAAEISDLTEKNLSLLEILASRSTELDNANQECENLRAQLSEARGMVTANDNMQSQQLESWRVQLKIPDSIQVAPDLVDDICEHCYALVKRYEDALEWVFEKSKGGLPILLRKIERKVQGIEFSIDKYTKFGIQNVSGFHKTPLAAIEAASKEEK